MIWALLAACLVATVPAGLRWLRIAQREHYLPPAVATFAGRWWTSGSLNVALLTLMVGGLVGSWWTPWWAFLVPAAQVGPIGLGVRGRTSPLAWTGRLRRVAGLATLITGAVYAGGVLIDSAFFVAVGLFLLPAFVDLALLALLPVERLLGRRWVDQAASRLRSSGAKVVAITGSYGKTTTKLYTAHLLAGSFRVVASPASFNNRMGLARAVNENLVPGTEVFVAEMGTYGPGEIADLTTWIPPEVAALVAIGPVHLERFGTEERIVAAKAEILERAKIGVIAVDHPLLAALAEQLEGSMEVVTVSTSGAPAKVRVDEGRLRVDDVDVAAVPDELFPVNLGVAVAIGLVLGVPLDQMARRLEDLPVAEHRQSIGRSEQGFAFIDDTFNSNPEGARSGLRTLARIGAGGRKAVVTPGMVEMGREQYEHNRVFAAEAAEVADDLLIVGATNRRALLEGSANGRAAVTVVSSRQEAVEWARRNLRQGDAVLYENDLPDHYP